MRRWWKLNGEVNIKGREKKTKQGWILCEVIRRKRKRKKLISSGVKVGTPKQGFKGGI